MIATRLRENSNTPATILVAEDHEDSRDAIRALLEAVGYRVVVATNGEEAVQAAREHRPDLILMDIMMPDVDGFEATRRIRGMREIAAVPILAVTAMEGSREQTLRAGCNAHLSKPVDVPKLLETVRAWLAHPHAHSAG